MSRFLTQLESFVRRRGIIMPRLYLLAVLAILGLLLGFICLPYSREFLATVMLHDWFVVCAAAIGGPLFLCDPSRARNPFWAAFHLVCLSAAALLALFFLCFCELAYRDDRAFLTLLAAFASVIIGRAYVADLVITTIARSLAASDGGRAHLLSAYARMLDVDPSIAGLRPPSLSVRLVLSVRERCQRILGLRRTRSRAIEEEVSRAADRLAYATGSRPTPENIARHVSAMAHEVALHRVLVSPGVGSRDVAERWPGDFISRWTALMRGFQRSSSRVRGTVSSADERETRAELTVELLEEARAVMLVVHRDDPAGDKEIQAAIALFRPKARVAARDLRLEFDRHVLGFRRTTMVPKKAQFAFMLVALATAEQLPQDFVAVYGADKYGVEEWKKSGLPAPYLAVCLVVARRCQLESGGLTPAQAGPVMARLLQSSAQAGFSADDYPEAAWGELMQAASLQWHNFAKGTKALELSRLAALTDEVEPGVGRISLTNFFACAMLALAALFLTLSSPFWLPQTKPFNDLFGPYARANAKARSIDLASDASSLAVATADQGLLSIDVRNYSVSRTGVPDGLSSNELTDVIALSDRSFAVTTEGLYGAKGLDFVREGKGSPIIGLPVDDHAALTAEPPLTMVNVGGDALFVFTRGLLYYDAARRVLVAVPGSPSEIIGACGSKQVEGRAWVLHLKDRKRTVCEIFRDSSGRFVFNDFTPDPLVEPSRIFHDGVTLWCIDSTRSSVHARQGDRWILRAGSPQSAKEKGGLASADALAISRRSPETSNDVLWMVKSGKVYARTIPRDTLQAELPMPWVEAGSVQEGYKGEVHAFCVDEVGYLIVPYPDRMELLSHRDPGTVSARKLLLPKDDERLRSIDVGSSGVVMATAGRKRSQVYLVDQRQFVGLALDSVRAEWPAPVQSSAFLASEFKFEDIVGAFRSDHMTYHFDSLGRWLKHDSSLHGLVNSGSELLPLEMSPEMLGKTKGLKVRGVSHSGDGTKFVMASNQGIFELPLSALGAGGTPVKAIVPVTPSMPAGASVPFGLSDTKSGPELYFREPRSDSQPEGTAPLASVWRLGKHLRFDSSWTRQLPGGGSGLIYGNSLVRSRIDRPDGGTRYGPPVALSEEHRLVFRDQEDDAWRLSALSGQWSTIVNAPEGGTVIRQRAGAKHDGDVMRISQLIPSPAGLHERRLWSTAASVPRGSLLSPDAVVPVSGRGFVFPTDESFWAYQPLSRSWEKLMDRAPGNVSAYRILSDEIRDAAGSSKIAWWSDDTNNVYAANTDKAAIFARVGTLSGGAASGTSYMTVNEANALFAFNLADASTRRLFAPINPQDRRSEVAAIEDSEAGIAFLPAGGGKVLVLDEEDRFVQADGPSFSAITNIDSRLVGIADIKGESKLAAVFSAGAGVGKDLNALHGLGGAAVMSASTGDMWMGGFTGGVLRARIIGDARATENPATGAKIVAAASHAGQLFVSVDGGIHHRPDSPGAEDRPGFRRIGWTGADWFRPVGGLGKLAPAGGLGCFTLSEDLKFSLISRQPDAGFRITNGMDIPIFGPAGGVFKLGSTGKVTPYDGADGMNYGGASMLGPRSKVHPIGAGLLLLSRSTGAGIAFYDPSTATDSALGFVTAADGKTRGCPFGPDVDFMYASESPADLPFLRDGRTLGRLSQTLGNIEIISERANSPLILAGRLRWLEGDLLMGAGSIGGTALSKEDLPDVSSSGKGMVKGLLLDKLEGKLAMVLDGALVEVDLKTDKFVKKGPADVLFALPGGVATALGRGGETWVLADGTVPLPAILRDLGPVKLAQSPAYLSAYDNEVKAGRFWVKGVASSGMGAEIDFSINVSPGRNLTLAVGSTISRGRNLVHLEHEKVYRYDLDRGEWSEPSLPVGFTASSIRRHKDGRYFIVDERNADLVSLGADGRPEGEVLRGAAVGVSLDAALVGVKSLAAGGITLSAGGKPIQSEVDEWPRLTLAFSDRSPTYSSNSGATLFFAAEDSSKAKLFVRRAGRLVESDIVFPKALSALSIYERPDGLHVTDDATFSQGILISDDGDVSMSFGVYDYSPPGRLLVRDRCPKGWIKVAGVYHHSTGYASGRAPVADVPVRMIGKRLMVNVRKVSFDGESEEIVALPVDCGRASEMSLIHPDFRKPSMAESVSFDQDYVHADFNGQQVRVLGRSVLSGRPAEVDVVSQLAILNPRTMVQLDGQGGMWKRDIVSGLRTFMANVPKQARLSYYKRHGSEVLSVALDEPGRRRLIGEDATLVPTSTNEGEAAPFMDRLSLVIDRLKARIGQAGFTFELAERFPLSVASDGWVVEGASPSPVLRATSSGSLLLEFRSTRASSAPVLRVPAEGERRILRADLDAQSSFAADPVITSARTGGYSFDWSTGTLIVRHDGVARPLALAPGGGIESDHYAKVTELHQDGRHHFICISKVSGRVFARSWVADSLGSLTEVALPGASVRPDQALSVDGSAYVRAGADWFALSSKDGIVSATRLPESPLRSWGEIRKDVGVVWAFEKGKIMVSTGSDWDEVPCRSDPVALACDLPSPLFEDYRALPSGGIVFKSRMSDGGRPLWYALTLEGGVPRRYEAALPARHVPPDALPRQDGLGNPMVFSRSKLTTYTLELGSSPGLQIGLQVQPGIRLPHLGEFSDAKASGGAVYFRAGKTSSQAQIYLRVPEGGGRSSLTLDAPAFGKAIRSEMPSEWWISEGRVSLSWIPGKGLVLGMKSAEGLRSFATLGTFVSGKPFEADDASQIRLRSARLKSFSFSTDASPETVMVMSSDGYESWDGVMSIYALPAGASADDVFGSVPDFLAEEMRPVDHSSGDFIQGKFSCSLTQEGGVEVRPGLFIPLHRSEQLDAWVPPQGEAVAAIRLGDGGLVIQSCGGAWISRYDASGDLVSGRHVDASDPSRIRWSESARSGVALVRTDSARLLNLSDLSDGDSTDPAERHVVEAGLSLTRNGSGLFALDLPGLSIKSGVYPSVDFQVVSLHGDKVALGDAYGVRTLEAGLLSSVLPGEVKRRSLGDSAGPASPDGADSCGAWRIVREGGRFDVLRDGVSVLDRQGVPFVDSIEGFDGYENHLVFVHQAKAVITGSSRVTDTIRWGVGEGMIDRAMCRDIRLAITDEGSRHVLDFGRHDAAAYDIEARMMKTGASVRRPAGVLAGSTTEFLSNQQGDFEMRVVLREGDLGPAFVRYVGREVIAFNQLASDRVLGMKAVEHGLFVLHPPSAGSTSGWHEKITVKGDRRFEPCRERDGRCESIEVPGSYLRPWSETRNWGIRDGKLYWEEVGVRWGD